MHVCVFPQWWKYVNYAHTVNDSCHTPKTEEKKKTEENSTFTGGHKLSWWNFAQIKKKKKKTYSNLIKHIYAFVPRRGGEARFDKSDMWVDRAHWDLNTSLHKKKRKKSVKWSHRGGCFTKKPDFGLVEFRLCKRIRKCVCAVLLIHFYSCSELSLLSDSQRKCFKRL